jgi:DNA polymerase
MAAKSRTTRAVAQQLKSLEQAGMTHLPKDRSEKRPASRSRPESSASAEESQIGSQPKAGKSKAAVPERPAAPPAIPRRTDGERVSQPKSSGQGDQATRLQTIHRKVARCVLCKELARTRTQTVFGDGNPQARLVFMGEAPGADEDQQGLPFVGQAGQLLNRIIENVCGMKREDVYILNTIKCRPPGNRTPDPQEIANCRPFLDAQLEVIRPEFICCLGAVASQSLLNTAERIGKLRGRVWDYQGVKVVCTYHPAYLLRNPAAKRDVWEDVAFLLKEMGIEPKKKPS